MAGTTTTFSLRNRVPISSLPPRPNKKLINQASSSSKQKNSAGRGRSVNGPSDTSNELSSQSNNNNTKRFTGSLPRKKLPDSYRSYNTDNFDLYPNKEEDEEWRKRPISLCALVSDSEPSNTLCRSGSLRKPMGVGVGRVGVNNEIGYGFRSFPGSEPGSSGWLWQKSLSEGNLERVVSEEDRIPVFLEEMGCGRGDGESWNGSSGRKKKGDKNKTTNYPNVVGRDKSTSVMMRENKSLPTFFRSISLRNLLQSELICICI